MNDLLAWLARLERGAAVYHPRWVRALLPSAEDTMHLDDFIIASHSLGVTFGAPGDRPRSAVVLNYLDTDQQVNLFRGRDLSADIGALLSYVSGRRVVVLPEIAVDQEGHPDKKTFLGFEDVFDRRAEAPITSDLQEPIRETLELLRGVSSDDVGPIGAAMRFHYASLLLFDRDLSAAYVLLVAALEVLSRAFGSAPAEWDDWSESSRWNRVFEAASLSASQAEMLRAALLRDKQLRLAETFAEYSSSRPRDAFFTQHIEDWFFTVSMSNGAASWHGGDWNFKRPVSQEVPVERSALRSALRITYDVRSRYVHDGQHVPAERLLRPVNQAPVDGDPLSYAGLRLLVREVIACEIEQRCVEPVPIPDFRIRRRSTSSGDAAGGERHV